MLLAPLLLGTVLAVGACSGTSEPRGSAPGPAPAELILSNGAVFPMDARRSRASAVVVAGGRIVFVGADEEALSFRGPDTRVLDLGGRMVLPGLHDSHVHLVQGGLAQTVLLFLADATTLPQIQDEVARYAAAHPDASWINGGGWDPSIFPLDGPTHQMLDAVLPDRPIYLIGADGHTAWVNQKALELAGITAATPDPPNGRIVRDAWGEPTGTLREAATQLVATLVPPPTRGEFLAAARAGQALANRSGITSIYDALATPGVLQAYGDLEASGELTLRVLAALPCTPAKGPEQVATMTEARARARGRLLRPDAAKIFMDGIIEGQTAALLEPYVGTGDFGVLNYPAEVLDPLVRALDDAGFALHFHAIGDRAVRGALDSVEALGSPPRRRPILAHVQLVDPVDLPRLSRLGCSASIEARWASRDEIIRLLTEPRLGPERSSRLYPFGSMRDCGTVLAGGSDWPVTSLDPLEAVQIAVTRRPLDAGPGPAWLPEQVLGLQEILEAYTLRGAYAQFQEGQTGSLEVGRSADIVVLDRNLFEVPAHEIAQARVVRTFLEGREVYAAP